MNVFGWLRDIDRKFAWSFIGVLLALFGFWYARENPASLRIELLSKARVYDIHADVPGLAIFFENENIKEKKQVLTFFTVRLSNPGGKPITQNLFDTTLPFGLQLFKGRAFPPEVVEGSQAYIVQNLKPKLVDGTQIGFEKIVIDAGASFTIRFLVLHAQDEDPFLRPVGKIAGIPFDSLQVIAPQAGERTSFWHELISGSLWVHLTRFFGYIASLILLGLAIVLPTIAFESFRSKRRRRRIAARFRQYQGSRDTTYAELLAGIAVDFGDKALVLASRLDGLRVSKRTIRSFRRMQFPDDTEFITHPHESPFFFAIQIITRLQAAGAIERRDGALRHTKEFKENLSDFQAFWRATYPSDPEAAEEFVSRTIQHLSRANAVEEPDAPN